MVACFHVVVVKKKISKTARTAQRRSKVAEIIQTHQGDKVYPKWGHDFIEQLVETNSVEAAREHVGVAWSTLERIIHGCREFKEDYDKAWHRISTVQLERSAIDRALNGWLEPVYYQGIACGTKRVFSNALTIFMLKANWPEKYHLEKQVADSTQEEQVRMLRQFLSMSAPRELTSGAAEELNDYERDEP